MFHKFFTTSLLFSFLVLKLAAQTTSQEAAVRLEEADSLYANKRYTEALEIYSALYDNRQATPAMLLRMAFIHEGLNKDVEAIYFLYQYYELTADRKVLNKIAELADANDLEGYVFTDTDFLLNVYKKYHHTIVAVLASLALLMVVLAWRQRKHGSRPISVLIVQCVFLLLFFALSNNLFEKKQGIVSSQYTVMMTAPSAAAKPVATLQKGQKVDILGKKEVWSVVRWGNQKGYIRNTRILPI